MFTYVMRYPTNICCQKSVVSNIVTVIIVWLKLLIFNLSKLNSFKKKLISWKLKHLNYRYLLIVYYVLLKVWL